MLMSTDHPFKETNEGDLVTSEGNSLIKGTLNSSVTHDTNINPTKTSNTIQHTSKGGSTGITDDNNTPPFFCKPHKYPKKAINDQVS